MESTSKKLVKDVFRSADVARPVFVPLLCGLAAKLEQVSVREMLNDPTRLSNSLQHAQNLFGYDAVASVYDPTLEAEALGCRITWLADEVPPQVSSHPLDEDLAIDDFNVREIETSGRIPIVLEATKRLVISIGNEVAILGVVTGPVTLARNLKASAFPDESEALPEAGDVIRLAGKAILRLCRAYCELGVDGILIVEEKLNPMHHGLFSSIASVLQTIRNVAKFYNTSSLILAKECSNEDIDPLFALPIDGALIGRNTEYERIESAAARHKRSFGICIPHEALLGSRERVGDGLAKALAGPGKKGFFISTGGEIPSSTPVANVHEIVKMIAHSAGGSPTA